jgi:predicted RNA binding protein YcfA (HicA-like mRNA interferase family)
MPKLDPIKRRELIHYLRKMGYDGPYSGGNHQFLVKSGRRLFIPNPHGGEISKALLSRILSQAKIDKNEWEKL